MGYSCVNKYYKSDEWVLLKVVYISFSFLALFVGVLATIHKSSIGASKIFTSGKIETKAE